MKIEAVFSGKVYENHQGWRFTVHEVRPRAACIEQVEYTVIGGP